MSEMYAGAVLFNDLYASTHILNSIRAAIGSQCKSISALVTGHLCCVSCYPPFASIAKGEVFVLLLRFCSFFCQRFLDNPRANSRQILHAGVIWFRMCLLPFWGLAAPGRRKKGEMKFLLLWESMGNFCILAVFQRYLSNACTDPHQILFM